MAQSLDMDRTLSGASSPGQSWPGSNGNKEVVCILKSSSITGASPSDTLVSKTGHWLVLGGVPLHRDPVGVFYSPSWLGLWLFYLIANHTEYPRFEETSVIKFLMTDKCKSWEIYGEAKMFSSKNLVWFVFKVYLGFLMPNPFLYIKTVLFNSIQFGISTLFSSI